MTLAIYGLAFGAGAILGWVGYFGTESRARSYVKRRVEEARVQLEDMFVDIPPQRLMLFVVLVPLGLGLLIWVVTGLWQLAIVGAALGLLIPKSLLGFIRARRNKKFQAMLVDALLLMSSCLRAGLSMLQSFTVVSEEMPAPVNQEFSLLLKEVRMGVKFEEALIHFKSRVPSEDVNLFITAVMVSRETGGDVTAVFTKLVETLRERKKIRERIKTLTFMARLQGIVMALLPIAFVGVTYSIDKSHFNFFLQDPIGQMALAGVVVSELVVLFLFIRFSRTPM